jgi:hypothetical protein
MRDVDILHVQPQALEQGHAGAAGQARQQTFGARYESVHRANLLSGQHQREPGGALVRKKHLASNPEHTGVLGAHRTMQRAKPAANLVGQLAGAAQDWPQVLAGGSIAHHTKSRSQ